jgi:hypothetical protein
MRPNIIAICIVLWGTSLTAIGTALESYALSNWRTGAIIMPLFFLGMIIMCSVYNKGNTIMQKLTGEEALKRVEELEEAITEASLMLCESKDPLASRVMKIFDKVMNTAARKRMGI